MKTFSRSLLTFWHACRFLTRDSLLGYFVTFALLDTLWLTLISPILMSSFNNYFFPLKTVPLLLLLCSIILIFLTVLYQNHQESASKKMFGEKATLRDTDENPHDNYSFIQKKWLTLPIPLSRKLLLLHARIPVSDALECRMADEDLAVLGALLRDDTNTIKGSRN